ncbi:MAG: GIY-YIG nuclease family protein [Spirochaetaceae bacterium]|jgi:hypothetical protein|nr:GIY-YIG nuclease family protein [Spirochaetaceae bacterium]
MEKQYIYIAQAFMESAKCKIGKTNDLERRLKEYNSITGKSKDNAYRYLFACEVNDMAEVENAVKENFSRLREQKNREIYFYNSDLFNEYVAFIKSREAFLKEIPLKTETQKEIAKTVNKTAPSLKERGLSKIAILHKAKKRDNDEFYTRYEDVEQELSMYRKTIWKNKVVFCNCGDAVDDDEKKTSAFALYFLRNFNGLSLKKLICTQYSGKADLFNQGAKGYIFTKYGFNELDRKKDYPDGYTGSFDDPLSLKILREEADIVCTNPPFSKAIDFWKILIGSGKKFLIISNITSAISTAFIPYFKNNTVWAGYNEVDWFLNPKKEPIRAAGHWYTNLSVKDRPKYKHLKIMPLQEIPAKYKKYDDNNMLIVDKSYIPSDYQKPFAVSARTILNGLLEKGYIIINEKQYDPCINGTINFKRVLVQKI